MKTWYAVALVLGLVAAVYAKDEAKKEDKPKGPSIVTKEQYVEHQKARAEKKGEEFDQAAAEANFDAMDKNKDGVLTPDERGKGHKEGKKEKGEKETEESAGTSDSE